MVPWPSAVLDRVIYWLQEGSTDVTYAIFKAVGVPVFRQGFVLTVPGVAIEVASECSGIRSSMALLITCLLAAHFYLRTRWKILLFVLLVIPLSIIKNGIRIATLTLLSLYVDPSFLTGSLHREGGFVFFLLALAIMFPALRLLERSEKKAQELGDGGSQARTNAIVDRV
ncbi:MAG TPA: exosortase/archaeosortase family protein, partial [Candidatus Acidoferrales bacterium]|nr:exosortase/archaeosortase family protein [Candidatus Acidoferrales bacterium]